MKWITGYYAISAVNRRNIKLLLRQKQFLVAPFLMPVVVMILTALIMGAGGDDWPVGLVNESNTMESQEFVKTLKKTHSNITPYFSIKEMEYEQASDALKKKADCKCLFGFLMTSNNHKRFIPKPLILIQT